MVTTVGLERKSRYSSRTGTKKPSPLEIRELAVFCPKCKDLEVLWFVNGQLVQTRKFTQYGERYITTVARRRPVDYIVSPELR
jgi:hypothetical protein